MMCTWYRGLGSATTKEENISPQPVIYDEPNQTTYVNLKKNYEQVCKKSLLHVYNYIIGQKNHGRKTYM